MDRVKIAGPAVWKALGDAGNPKIGGFLLFGAAERGGAGPPRTLSNRRRTAAMADLVLIALTIAVFAMLGLVVKAVGRL
ncbi:hypothetical protein [Actinocorallia libanotica]|uniref:Uncharacterized protein n=1 Tax=Actinocorallia libanotica TaxID=46162 RepID=A0ABN1RMD3_9ACTN